MSGGASRPVLVTGASGQLGTELCALQWEDGLVPVGLERSVLDLADADAIMRAVAAGHDGAPWAAVVNAGAYTAVDKAEGDAVTAWRVNALAPAAFGHACATAGIPLIQLSTDYVFSGDKDGAWLPDDHAAPLGVYGASKLGGELAVHASGARHAIVRTAWVVSAHGSNFVKTMLRLARERDTIRVVADQRGTPTSAADLAAAIATIAAAFVGNPSQRSAVHHVTNSGSTSWAQFAAEIFRQSRARGGPFAAVEPIASAEFPTPARRPGNSVLDDDRIDAAYGLERRPWQAALGPILDTLLA